jgi:hypothetical protein
MSRLEDEAHVPNPFAQNWFGFKVNDRRRRIDLDCRKLGSDRARVQLRSRRRSLPKDEGGRSAAAAFAVLEVSIRSNVNMRKKWLADHATFHSEADDFEDAEQELEEVEA